MHPQNQVGGVTVSVTADGVAHLGQIQRCASVWACNVCAPVIRERRAAEIDRGVSVALDKGYFVYFVTATVRHHLGDQLEDVYKLVQSAWSKTFSGGAATRWARSRGMVGSIRTIEITYGANGWHPHIHAILIFKRPSESSVRALGEAYGSAVRSFGGSVLVSVTGAQRSPGWDVSPVRRAGALAQYLTKVHGGWGAGLELARADVKRGRRGGLSPVELLTAASEGDQPAARLFEIFERATAGKRCIVWSRGLKAVLEVEEVSDDDAAITPRSAEVVRTWHIRSDVWRAGAKKGLLGIWINQMISEAVPLADTG